MKQPTIRYPHEPNSSRIRESENFVIKGRKSELVTVIATSKRQEACLNVCPTLSPCPKQPHCLRQAHPHEILLTTCSCIDFSLLRLI
eukprot:m.51463 g.51463  ORF g.51463 m.51463 type:complete len:87 (-) comp9053_c0_seq1:1668-1928(-)